MASAQSGGPSPLWKGRWLIVLGIIAVLPLAALAAYAAWQDQQLQRLRARDQARELSLVAAKSAEGFAAQTLGMLVSLAREPAIANQDPAAARQELASHLAAYPDYADICVAGADGSVYADPQAPPGTPARSIAGEPYFQEAMQSGRPSIYTMATEGPNGHRTRLVLCLPVLDQAGRPKGTVQAIVDPAAVRALVSPTSLPPGASVVLVGADGTIILHSTDPARWTGQRLPTSQAGLLRSGQGGAQEGVFLDQPSLVGASAVAGTAWQQAVVIPMQQALATWQVSLWSLGLAFAAASAAALFLGVRTATVGAQGWRSQDFLRSLVESASVGVAVASGPNNRIEFANPVFCRITGGQAGTIAGRPLRDVLPAEPAEAAERYIDQVYRTNRAVRAREVATQSGDPPRTAYWDMDYLPLRTGSHRVGAVLILAMPVTERVRARQEIESLARQAEERAAQLQAVLAAISDVVLVYDANGNLAFMNSAAARLAGAEATPEATERLSAGLQSLELYWPDGRPIVGEERQRPRALGGEVIVGEEFMYRPPAGGPLRWVRSSAAPVRDREGKITGAVVTAGDITAQKEVQVERDRLLAEVQGAQQYLQTLLNRLPDGVAVVDSTLHVTLVNEALRQLLGRDIAGRSIDDLDRELQFFGPAGQLLPPGERPVQRLQRGEAASGMEMRALRPDGSTVDLLIGATPLHDRGMTTYIIALTDITARKRAEAERERLLREVQQARENLYAIVDRLPDWVLAFDASLHVTLTSEALRRESGRDLAGMPVEDVRRMFDFRAADGWPFPPGQAPVERAVRGETALGIEVRAHMPDGTTRYAIENAAPLYDPDGRIYGAVVIQTDITPQKVAEAERERLLAEVQAARAHLQTVVDRLPDWVLVLDAEMRVTMSNEAVRQRAGRDLAGMTADELWRTYEFVQADGRPFPPGQSPGERAMRGETVTNAEMRIRLPDGSLADALESVTPLYGPDGRISGIVVVLADITELKRAEAERERLLADVEGARRELQTLIESLPTGVLVTDAELRITLANDVANQYMGPDLIGRTVDETVHGRRFEAPSGAVVSPDAMPLQRALRGEVVTGMELRVYIPGGLVVDTLSNAVALHDAQGRTTGAVLVVTDITAQKQAQAELQAARQNLQTILDQLPDGVLVVDAQERVVSINDTIRDRIQPYAVPDPIGQSLQDLRRGYAFRGAEGEPFPEGGSPLERALRQEVVMGTEVGLQLPDGQRLSVLESAAPLRAPDGQAAGAVVALTDITVLRQAQAERERLLADVQAAREELRGIVNRLPDGVLVIDPTLHVTLCNEAAISYIGRDVTGEPAPGLWRELHFLAADHRPFSPGQTPVERALHGQTVVGVEVSLEFRGGRHVDALDSAAAVYNPDGSVREVAMVFTDITPLKELDRAKDEFISFAAHELRTPLTALKGHAQILLRRAEHGGWAESDQRNLRTIDNQVDRLNDLIGRLLNVSRIRLGRLQLSREPTDIVALAREVAENLQVTTNRHRIRVQAEISELVGNWDAAALRQVLTNLISNAIRYADPGPIDVRVRHEAGQAVLSVTDYGPGIPPERQAQIFEAFRPGAAEEYRRAGGLGLGLYISRGIVEAHGGRIEVQSEVGVGTTFTASLPVNGRRG